jgi:hypothetical protein
MQPRAVAACRLNGPLPSGNGPCALLRVHTAAASQTAGRRYRVSPADTAGSELEIPLWPLKSVGSFLEASPTTTNRLSSAACCGYALTGRRPGTYLSDTSLPVCSACPASSLAKYSPDGSVLPSNVTLCLPALSSPSISTATCRPVTSYTTNFACSTCGSARRLSWMG